MWDFFGSFQHNFHGKKNWPAFSIEKKCLSSIILWSQVLVCEVWENNRYLIRRNNILFNQKVMFFASCHGVCYTSSWRNIVRTLYQPISKQIKWKWKYLKNPTKELVLRELYAINHLIFCFRAVVGFTNKHRVVGISAKNQVSLEEKTFLSQFWSLHCFQWKLSDKSW